MVKITHRITHRETINESQILAIVSTRNIHRERGADFDEQRERVDLKTYRTFVDAVRAHRYVIREAGYTI